MNVIVNPSRTACLQAPENWYSEQYTDLKFEKCDCFKPLRPKTEIYCKSLPHIQARRELITKCNKDAANAVAVLNNWTNNTGPRIVRDPDTKSVISARNTEQEEPNESDWFAIISIMTLLPLIFTSMVLGMSNIEDMRVKHD